MLALRAELLHTSSLIIPSLYKLVILISRVLAENLWNVLCFTGAKSYLAEVL